MTVFLVGFLAGMVLYAAYFAVRSCRSNRPDEAEQLQRARRATTPETWRPF